MRIMMGKGVWVVIARWYGEDRIVFSDENIFACFRFVRESE